MAPANPTGGLMQWWLDNYIYVFVTDDLHPESDLFAANGNLKTPVDEAHYTVAEICFSEKPQWTMPNDTICYEHNDNFNQYVEFNLERSDVTVSPATAPQPDLTMLKFAFKPANGTEWQPLLSYGGDDPSVDEGVCKATDAEGVEKELRVKIMKSVGKPDPDHELQLIGAGGVDSVFDSLVIRTVVRTDYSQTNDTLYSVLRIDRGIKSITVVSPTEVTVCEGDATEFEIAFERYNASIPSEIKWRWDKKGSDGSGSWTVGADETKARPLNGSTTKGVPEHVKLAFPGVQPSDSGVWIFATNVMRNSENRCQDKSSDDIELKVDLIPTFKEDLAVVKEPGCSGTGALKLEATLQNVNSADIRWEHYHQNAVDGLWTWVRDWDKEAGRVSMTNEAVDGNPYERYLT
ncbi:MAG: hypothetical protein K2I84_01825, partial [Bacteroidales bacterium]|nr:hypothetical protein [Bacteroidales bacterium]